MCRASCRARVL